MLYEITVSKKYIIKSSLPKSEVEANVDTMIDWNDLFMRMQTEHVEDVFDFSIRALNQPAELYCKNCGEEITQEELEENGQYCDECLGVDDYEDDYI